MRRVRVSFLGELAHHDEGIVLMVDGGTVATVFTRSEIEAPGFTIERLDEEAEVLALFREARKTFPTEEVTTLMERLKAALRG